MPALDEDGNPIQVEKMDKSKSMMKSKMGDDESIVDFDQSVIIDYELRENFKPHRLV